ncbi:Zinc finger BED domain-containing [Pleurotus pulmonarius]
MGHFDGPTSAKRKVVPTEKADGIPKKKSRTTKAQPKKNVRKTTVVSEEEDDAQHSDNGVEVIEIEDVDGNITTRELSTSKSDGEENDDAELERMRKKWRSPIYAFFSPEPSIEYKQGGNSTGNMHKHANTCWGKEAVETADEAGDVDTVRTKVVQGILRDGKITTSFERKGKGKVTYSHQQHTKTETKAEIVQWVTESLRPFKIVSDRGFQCLMKTGRPGYYLPSPTTVSRDVKMVFSKARNRIVKMLKEYDGDLNFATDAWTSPNHRVFVAITVHLEMKGEPLSMLLDLVEVAESHTGLNLAAAFARVLDDFGIGDKILSLTCDNASANDAMIEELAKIVLQFKGEKNRVRCFAHIINLVAKSLLRQFDELADLAENLDMEDLQTRIEVAASGEDDDDVEGWVDELESMSDGEREAHRASVQPVCLVLVKL